MPLTKGPPVSISPRDKTLFSYEIVAEDPATHARAGVFHTAHGDICTPVFMPVGTKGTVKGLLPDTVESLGAQIVLANTYHLEMRPGSRTVEELSLIHISEPTRP